MFECVYETVGMAQKQGFGAIKIPEIQKQYVKIKDELEAINYKKTMAKYELENMNNRLTILDRDIYNKRNQLSYLNCGIQVLQ
jgi:predicted  nucleic acid-binding Zn-ribbon protein